MIEPLNAQQRETGRVRFAFLSSLISLLFPHRLVLDSSNHALFCLLFLVLIELGETKERERERERERLWDKEPLKKEKTIRSFFT